MAKQTGHLWAVIQQWLDSTWNPPSQNRLAVRLGVSASALTDYKYAVHMPGPEFLHKLSEEIAVPYEAVLDAALKDHGYRGSASAGNFRDDRRGDRMERARDELDRLALEQRQQPEGLGDQGDAVGGSH